MKLSAFLRSCKQTARVSRQIRPTCNDISKSRLHGFSQFCVLHAKTIHSTLLHGQNSILIQLRNKKQIGFYMSTEWKKRDCLKYCKNYKKSACYMTDQLILLPIPKFLYCSQILCSSMYCLFSVVLCIVCV